MLLPRLLTSSAIGAVLALAAAPARAQSEATTVAEVVVTAAPYALSMDTITTSVNLLSAEEISLAPPAGIGDLLSGLPGLRSTAYGPGASRPVIRGLAGPRVLLLQNGVGMVDASDGVVRAMIERRAGASDDQRAWMRRERRERDVSTALLLDMSASTSLSLPARGPAAQTGKGSGSDTSSSSSKGAGLQAQSGALLYGFYDDTPESAQELPRRRVIDVARDSLALMALGLAERLNQERGVQFKAMPRAG
jgi:hypothetical protein